MRDTSDHRDICMIVDGIHSCRSYENVNFIPMPTPFAQELKKRT